MYPQAHLLGIAQDGGHPHIGCWRPCCAEAWSNPALAHRPACLGLVSEEGRWLLDATPDLPAQLAALGPPPEGGEILSGVVLTHAHLGHLAGLLQLGREALATRSVAVWAMPRMRRMIEENLPWSLLLEHGHVTLQPLECGARLGPFVVTPERVDHRNEASETVALHVRGPNRTLLYLPDIDDWSRYPLADRLKGVDRAYIDGTFYAADEIGWRDPATVPHPLVVRTMELLADVPERSKVQFIHLNHTNPLLDPASEASAEVRRRGFGVARQGASYAL